MAYSRNSILGLMAGYYHQEDLAHFADIGKNAPELWKKFSEWYAAVFAEGALTEREKSLIALAVAHTVQFAYFRSTWASSAIRPAGIATWTPVRTAWRS